MTLTVTCHCKKIQVEINELPEYLADCNCSICRSYSTLWGYYTPNQVTVREGSAGLDAYVWGDRQLEFMRCSNCGCVTHYVTTALCSEDIVAVNFRLLEPSVIEAIPVVKLDNATSENGNA